MLDWASSVQNRHYHYPHRFRLLHCSLVSNVPPLFHSPHVDPVEVVNLNFFDFDVQYLPSHLQPLWNMDVLKLSPLDWLILIRIWIVQKEKEVVSLNHLNQLQRRWNQNHLHHHRSEH